MESQNVNIATLNRKQLKNLAKFLVYIKFAPSLITISFFEKDGEEKKNNYQPTDKVGRC